MCRIGLAFSSWNPHRSALVRDFSAPQGLDALRRHRVPIITYRARQRSHHPQRRHDHRSVAQPDSMPAVVRIVWPPQPSITAPTPQALAALAAAMVRTLAEAQTELASKIRNSR